MLLTIQVQLLRELQFKMCQLTVYNKPQISHSQCSQKGRYSSLLPP